jgi:hypothetical protein
MSELRRIIEAIVAVAQRAEALGFDSLWVLARIIHERSEEKKICRDSVLTTGK